MTMLSTFFQRRSLRSFLRVSALLSLFPLISIPAAASEQYYLLDAETKAPIPSASVRITCLAAQCRDSSAVVVTDANGAFTLPFALPVAVKFSHVAYAPVADTLRAGGQHTFALAQRSKVVDPIVATAQYTPRRAGESLHRVRTIDAEKIQAQAASTLQDLMKNELNVRLGQDPVLGGSMSIQGVSGQNVKILVDGVPVVGRLNGNLDPGQVLLANAEQVEIVEGPLSVLYGTDALGGVVNIITKQPTAQNIEASATALYESVGTYNADVSLSGAMGPARLALSAGRHLFDGYSEDETQRSMQWKPREQYFADWQAAVSPGEWNVRYTGRYFHEYILNRGTPREPYRETAFDDKYITYRLTNSLFANGRVTDSTLMDVTAAYAHYERRKNTYFKDLVTTEERPTADPADHDTSSFGTWTLRTVYASDYRNAMFNYQAGLEATTDINSGKRIAGRDRSIGDYALFAGVQYTLSNAIALQPALRLAYNTRYDAPLIPSLNVKIAASPSATLRFSYARGFRAPALRELYFSFVDINHNIIGNEKLEAETSHNFTGALSYVAMTESAVFRFEPSVFYNDISNLITLAQVNGDSYSYVNLGTYRTLGASLTAGCWYSGFSAKLGISNTGRYNELSEQFDAPTYLFTPEVQADVMYDLPFASARLSLFYKYTGKLPGYSLAGDGSLQRGTVADYHTLDITASAPLFNKLLTVTAGGRNLLDVRSIQSTVSSGEAHSESASAISVAWGRSFFLQLQCTIQ